MGPGRRLEAAIDDARAANQLRHVVHRWLSCQEPSADADRDAHLRELLAPRAKKYRAFDGTLALEMQHLQITDRGGGNVTAHVDVHVSGEVPRLVRADVEFVRLAGQWCPRVASVRTARSTERMAALTGKSSRGAATMYAWLGLLDGAGAHVEHVRELVTDDAVITKSRRMPVTGVEAVVAWVAADNGHVSRSCHHVDNLEVCEDRDGWQLSVRMRLGAIATDGQAMITVEWHRWQLREDGGRYARIAAMDIVVEDDLTPANDAIALAHLRGPG